MMTLFDLVAVLIVVGVLLWAVEAFPAIDATIKQIIRVLVILFAVLYVCQALGLVGALTNVRLR